MADLHGHFKKAAAHHEKMAAYYQKAAEGYASIAAHHETLAECSKADVGAREAYAALAGEHKSLSERYSRIAKAHAAHAEHMHKMAAVQADKGDDGGLRKSILDDLFGDVAAGATGLESDDAIARLFPRGSRSRREPSDPNDSGL